MAKADLTAERLRELLHYDQNTGVFTRLLKTSPTSNVGDIAGYRAKDGYHAIWLCGRTYYAHRLAWLHVHGVWPAADIDHINGKRSDNRFTNLRDVPRSINCQNQRSPHRRSASGVLGVSRNNKRWMATIEVAGVVMYLGTYDTIESAHAAYVSAKRVLHDGCTL